MPYPKVEDVEKTGLTFNLCLKIPRVADMVRKAKACWYIAIFFMVCDHLSLYQVATYYTYNDRPFQNQNMMKPLLFIIPFLCLIGCSTNKFVHSDSGLKYKVLKKGKGVIAKEGNEVLIHEKMSYQNDSLLFSSYNLPNPIKFLIGGNQVINGVDEGVRGMKKGEIRKLIVPPSLSKRMGNQTFPHPDSTLVYEVELIDILSKK